MRLYFMYLSMHFRTLLQHRVSFLIISLGQACFAITSFVSIILLVPPNIDILGFSRKEILLAGAIINISFALAECFARGFDSFGGLINSGKFDMMIIRPVSEVKQVFMNTVEFTKIGRFIVSLIVLLLILQEMKDISLIYILFLCISGSFVYTCLFIIYGSICFYTTNNLEIFNIVTDGTREFGKVPFSFYGKSVLSFLTFVIPLALVQYYPLLFILGKSENLLYGLSPILTLLFALPTILFWRKSRTHYSSVGS